MVESKAKTNQALTGGRPHSGLLALLGNDNPYLTLFILLAPP